MSDKLQAGIKAGSTDVSLPVELRSTSNSTEVTGKVHTDVTGSYWRQGGVRVAISAASLANVDSAHSDGGFKEVDSTNMPGLYRFDIPDAAFATGADWVVITVKVSGCFVQHFMFALTTNVIQTGDNFARLGAPAGASVSADIAAIVLDTAEIGTAGAGLSGIPWNTDWAPLVAEAVLDAAMSSHLIPSSVGASIRDAAVWSASNNGILNNISKVNYEHGGTAQGGTSTSITLDSAAALAFDDVYIGAYVHVHQGVGAGQTRVITDYNGTTKEATVAAWSVTPDATSEYYIIPRYVISSGGGGDATAANQNTIITHLNDIKGATFSGGTDSLEAIRNRGDAAWLTATGFSTHSAADVWAAATRTLTSGTNIALVKGVGITGFNDLDAAAIRTALGLAAANLDTQFGNLPTAAEIDALLSLSHGAGSWEGSGGGGDATASNQTTIINHLLAIRGSTFDTSTDSLEAIRNRGDSAWTTASGFATVATILNALLSGYTIPGSVGAALSAAGASGDPWATLVPGSYPDGSAGAALGRLNNTAPGAPVLVIPDAPAASNMCLVYGYLYKPDGSVATNAELVCELVIPSSAPAKSDNDAILASRRVVTHSDSAGLFSIELMRTDAIATTGATYSFACREASLTATEVELTDETFNLASLIS